MAGGCNDAVLRRSGLTLLMKIAIYDTEAQINAPLELNFEQVSRHLLVMGKTGVGKSTLAERYILDGIEKGDSIIFIDPHGTSAMRLLERIPRNRYRDVCYFNAADTNPVGFSPTVDVPYEEQFVRASAVTAGIRHVFRKSWGDRLDWYTLRSVHLAIEHNRPLTDVYSVLASERFRNKLTERIRDPSLRQFWLEEFAGQSQRYIDEAKGPFFNKLGLFSARPHIRAIMNQEKPKLDIRQFMDTGKIPSSISRSEK